MIKVNEYRLGIIVMDVEPYDKIYKVDINMLVNAINGISYRPVPLTPEWLERCGFSIKHEATTEERLTYSILKMDLDIAKEEEGYYLRYECQDSYYDCNIGTPISFLHQLQNLYFALTGEELNVKL